MRNPAGRIGIQRLHGTHRFVSLVLFLLLRRRNDRDFGQRQIAKEPAEDEFGKSAISYEVALWSKLEMAPRCPESTNGCRQSRREKRPRRLPENVRHDAIAD